MGRVTLFTKKDCSFCDRTLALLHEAMPAAASAAAAAVGARLGAAAAADIGLELLEVWVDEDPARLTQCLHLTKQHTVGAAGSCACCGFDLCHKYILYLYLYLYLRALCQERIRIYRVGSAAADIFQRDVCGWVRCTREA